jgi:hypothetical protein
MMATGMAMKKTPQSCRVATRRASERPRLYTHTLID